MPGSEPFIRVEVGDRVVSIPADISLLQLWTILEHTKLADFNARRPVALARHRRARTFSTRATER
jgi:hypothetical protein